MPFVGRFYRSANNPASLPLVVDGGVRLELPLIEEFDSIYHWDRPKIAQIRPAYTVALLCCPETKRESFVKVPIQRWGDSYFGRSRELLIEDVGDTFQVNSLFQRRHMISIAAERRISLGIGDIIVRTHAFTDSIKFQGIFSTAAGQAANYNAVIEARILQVGQKFGYDYSMEDLSPRHGFQIIFSRGAVAGKPGDSLLAELLPLDLNNLIVHGVDSPVDHPELNNPPNESEIDGYGLKWWPVGQGLDSMPTHSHVMKTPLDIWNLDTEPFPPISVRMEIMLFDEDESFVDVLDLVIRPKKGSDDQSRRLCTFGY
ncbi:hypothetical protein GJ744_002178 [Endocarpon pusillum]|uniref:Uncharacterized protein n=1 Tax=Endocarpon pusillum TaxID=364733 RepID=A0A8H7A8H4_9EURO|nr:hypothetical protein GJ744_002178 [Endocarpon pusillum]